jgi:hypothetical protein
MKILSIGDPHLGALERFLGFWPGVKLQLKAILVAIIRQSERS